jgi:general secretion pathway protein D
LRQRVVIGIATLVCAALLSGCAASRAFKQGQEAAQLGNWDAAVAYFTKAVQSRPDRSDYKVFLERAMIEASRVRLERARRFEAAGDLEAAIGEYRKVLEYHSANREAMQKASELEKIVRDRLEASRPKPPIEQMRERARRQTQPPLLNPASREPITLRFTNASTQDILTFIGTAAGINVAFERDFRPASWSIQLEGVTLEEALNQVLSANQLWYKVTSERGVLVIPDNTQKRQLYEDQVIRTFFISHADPQELSQLVNQITRVAGAAIQPTIAVNKTANTISVRGTRGMIEIIERVIESNDRPRAEVVIDVDILEVSRARAKQYGLNLSSYSVGVLFSPEVPPSTGTDGTGSVPPFNLNTISQGVSMADFYMTVPSAVARFLATDSQTRQLAKPQLRGSEGQKLTLNLGDEIPVPSTVFTPIATGGAAANPLTSFSYRPVGINLEITPRVTYEGDVMLELQVESSNLGDSVNIAGQALPSFGSRKVTTKLRLREGESNLLAGLISERDRRTLRGIPGVMNLPFFRQLLSENDSTLQQTEIVMILTPKVIRTHELRDADLAPINIGTQQNLSLTGPPPLIAPMPPDEPVTPAPRPAEPVPPGAFPGSAAAPGVPTSPAAAPPGMPAAGVSPGPGMPGATAQPTVRLPEGTTARPVLPPGSSPIPGTTTSPPPAPVPAEPAPAEPAPPAPAAPPPAETESPAAAGQVTLTSPSSEMRVGAGPYTVPISINGVSRVSVLSLSITFNPAILRVRSVQEGGFLRQGGVAVTFTQQVDPTAGRLDISMARTGDAVGASGSGLLAAVLFDPIAPGSAMLTLSGVVTTPQGQPVPVAFSPVTVTVK